MGAARRQRLSAALGRQVMNRGGAAGVIGTRDIGPRPMGYTPGVMLAGISLGAHLRYDLKRIFRRSCLGFDAHAHRRQSVAAR